MSIDLFFARSHGDASQVKNEGADTMLFSASDLQLTRPSPTAAATSTMSANQLPTNSINVSFATDIDTGQRDNCSSSRVQPQPETESLSLISSHTDRFGVPLAPASFPLDERYSLEESVWHQQAASHTALPRWKRATTCADCQRVFTTRGSARRHYRVIHLGVFRLAAGITYPLESRHEGRLIDNDRPPSANDAIVTRRNGDTAAAQRSSTNHKSPKTYQPTRCADCQLVLSSRHSARRHYRTEHLSLKGKIPGSQAVLEERFERRLIGLGPNWRPERSSQASPSSTVQKSSVPSTSAVAEQREKSTEIAPERYLSSTEPIAKQDETMTWEDIEQEILEIGGERRKEKRSRDVKTQLPAQQFATTNPTLEMPSGDGAFQERSTDSSTTAGMESDNEPPNAQRLFDIDIFLEIARGCNDSLVEHCLSRLQAERICQISTEDQVCISTWQKQFADMIRKYKIG